MRNFILKPILITLVIVTISCEQEKTNILIIGDSISIGYTPFVQENLIDVANIFHNPGNAQHTGKGLDSIETWIGDNEWDIIQFNWGLWDLCYRHPDSKEQGKRDKINGKITFNADDYGNNLDAIVKLIRKKSNAELIFVTTSYVPNREAGRFVDDAIKYNEIAQRVMESNHVKINDIYETSKEIHFDYGKGDNDVHYKKEGYKLLGKKIVNFLKHEIK
ncbi:SGNH/GDSL hydrolase family protein [Flavicella sp.]|uniref:SGNH/GDSL hydrolase family protein n=1 Tax=Flavicella sp. TaxID=2957742 RepID=UPI00301B48EB